MNRLEIPEHRDSMKNKHWSHCCITPNLQLLTHIMKESRIKFCIAAVITTAVLHPALQADVIVEIEPNNTFAQAQWVAHAINYEWLDPDPDVEHSYDKEYVTILGTGDNSYDYYKVSVGFFFSRLFVDIDYGWTDGGPDSFDSYIAVWREGFGLVAQNDDVDGFSDVEYSSGSVSSKDSFLIAYDLEPGDYIIGVAKSGANPGPNGFIGNQHTVPNGATYSLHVTRGFYPPPEPPTISVSLAGYGVEENEQYEFDPVELPPAPEDPDEEPQMPSETVQISITNTGDEVLDLTSVALTEPTGESHYSLDTTNMAQNLELWESTTVNVIFTPSSDGIKTATLGITSNAANFDLFRVRFSGLVSPPPPPPPAELHVAIAGSPWQDDAQYQFDSLELPQDLDDETGMPSQTVQIDIHNAGGQTLNLTSVELSEPGAEDHYTLDTTDLADSLAPLGSTSVSVSFAPTSVGIKTATLEIQSNSPVENFRVRFSGEAVQIYEPIILAPVIPSPLFAAGYVNQPLSIQATATHNPTSFSLLNQPAWLAVDSTGLISGTPTTVGVFSFKIRAMNGYGYGNEQNVEIFIEPSAGTPVITSGPTASGFVNDEFSFGLTVNFPATSFVIILGDLPPGITLDTATGELSGIPTSDGEFDIVFAASNESGVGKTSKLRINIYPETDAPVIISSYFSASVGVAFVGLVSSYPFSDSYVFEDLPAWLAQTGTSDEISGTPPAPGIYKFSVRGGYFGGYAITQQVVLVVRHDPDAPVISLPGTIYTLQGASFELLLPISPAFDNVTAEGLPPGVVLDAATGTLNGTPTVDGQYSVTLQASNPDGIGPAVEIPFVVQAVPATPIISGGLSGIAFTGEPFNLQLQAYSDPMLPVLSWIAEGLPAGMALDATTGLISGAPLVAGEFSVSVSAANEVGSGASAKLALRVIQISDVPRISSSASAQAFAEGPLYYQIASTNSPIMAYQAKDLPHGLSLNSVTGLIEGTVVDPGVYDIKISATNAIATGPVQILKLSVDPVVGAPLVLAPKYLYFNSSQEFSYEIPVAGMPDRPWPAGTGVFAENLPEGMVLNTSTGVVSGFPSSSSDFHVFSVRLRAVNAGVSGPFKTVNLEFMPAAGSAPTILAPAHLAVIAGNSLSFNISANSDCDLWQFYLESPNGYSGSTRFPQTPSSYSPAFTIPSSSFPQPGIFAYEALGRLPSSGVWGNLSGRPLRVDPAPGAPIVNSPDVYFARVGETLDISLTASGDPTTFQTEFGQKEVDTSPSGRRLPSKISPSPDSVFAFWYPLDFPGLGPIELMPLGDWTPGTSFDSATGQITGTPTVPGTYSFLIRAKNTAGWSLPKFTTLVVLPATTSPLATESRMVAMHHETMVASVPPLGQVGQLFSYTPDFEGAPDYFITRSLPPGLVCNEFNGSISGIPEAPGRFVAAIRPVTGTVIGAEVELTITILPVEGAPSMDESIVITGVAGTALDHNLTASPSPVGFNVYGFSNFLDINTATGHVSGMPIVPGTYRFSCAPFNAEGEGSPVTVSVIIHAAPGSSVIEPISYLSPQVGESFNAQLAASESPAFFDTGILPYGLHLDSQTGQISGTPLVTGTFEIPVWAVNSVGVGEAAILELEIEGAVGTPAITNPATTVTISGEPVAFQIEASPAADLFSLSPIPDGFTFDPFIGLLTGPGYPGSHTFTVSASNSLGQGTPKTISLAIFESPSAAWLFETFKEDADNLAIAGWDASPANDGIPNLIKYVLGFDPYTPSSHLLPRPVFEIHGENTYLTINIPKNPSASDVALIPEIAPSLEPAAWLSGMHHFVVIEESPSLLKVRDKDPVTSSSRRFVRIKADLP